MSFLGGKAQRIALDQVAFIFVRQLIIEAVHEQMLDPSAENAKGARIIEMLVKPGDFSEQLATPVRRYNLNNKPTPDVTKRKGIYANQTPQRGRGCGNNS